MHATLVNHRHGFERSIHVETGNAFESSRARLRRRVEGTLLRSIFKPIHDAITWYTCTLTRRLWLSAAISMPPPHTPPLAILLQYLLTLAERHGLSGSRRMSHVTRRTSHVARHTSHVTRHTSHVARRTSHVTRHTSHVTRRTSHVTRHTSHVIRHTSHLPHDQRLSRKWVRS